MKKTILTFFLIILASTTIFGAMAKNRIVFCHSGPLLTETQTLLGSIEKSLSRKRIELITFDYDNNLQILSDFTEKIIQKKGAKGIILLSGNPRIFLSIEKKCKQSQFPLAIVGNATGTIIQKNSIIYIPFLDAHYTTQVNLTIANHADNSEWEDNTLFSSALFLMQISNNILMRQFGESLEKKVTDTILNPIIFTYTDTKEKDLLKKLRQALITNPTSEIIITTSEMLPTLKDALIPQGKWLKTDNPAHLPVIALDTNLTALKLLYQGFIDTIVSTDIEKTTQAIMIPLLAAVEKKDLPKDFQPLTASPILILKKNEITRDILQIYGGEIYSGNEKDYNYMISSSPQ